ncbi:MAG: hypothetical protein E7375_01950 [Clostridiales bacterium]|nr:hypothetical protein [Clostridiales bacterium]
MNYLLCLHSHGASFVDSLYDAVLDALKVLPILFLAYLLVSFLSHDHSRKFSRFLSKKKKTSVLYASFLGCVPQCGFSSVIADLYSEKTVSLGTLIAVFIATSDEAIPIMISEPNSILDMLLLVAIKIVLAVFWGYMIDLIIKLCGRKKSSYIEKKYAYKFTQKQTSQTSQFEQPLRKECGHVHTDKCNHSCGHKHGDCCVNNIFLDAFIHTFNILIYIFVATFVLNLIVGYFGLEALQNLLTSNVYVQILIASLIGLIPNCASSVLLVELYMLYGTLSFPALLAGLTTGAGVGMVILWTRNKKHPLQNLGILVLQYVIGITSGFLLTLFF